MAQKIFKLTLARKINKTTTMGISASGKQRNSKTKTQQMISPKKSRNGY